MARNRWPWNKQLARFQFPTHLFRIRKESGYQFTRTITSSPSYFFVHNRTEFHPVGTAKIFRPQESQGSFRNNDVTFAGNFSFPGGELLLHRGILGPDLWTEHDVFKLQPWGDRCSKRMVRTRPVGSLLGEGKYRKYKLLHRCYELRQWRMRRAIILQPLRFEFSFWRSVCWHCEISDGLL